MRKVPLTLITVLCLAAVLFNSAYAGKHNRAHREKRDSLTVNTADVCAADLLQFAQGLIGTPYRPATSDPSRGFDCSGFVSYVFKAFNFIVPRSSCEFINVGVKIALEDARPGDIIIFTSPKKHSHRIGHVGIVFSNGILGLKFIHSTSGKEYGVTITDMDDTYKQRFVQIVRLLKTNDEPLAALN